MVDFSIEIITRGEKSLKNSLESMVRQSYDSFEIVCANSSSQQSVSKTLDDFSVKHVEVGAVKHLRGREVSHSLSSGRFSLMMDSTRLLEYNALDILKQYIENFDMVAIKEGSIGSGFWVNQAKIYKSISEKNTNSDKIKEKIPSYILPRLYKSNLLSKVFSSLKHKIPDKLFDSIGYGEHHIIFQEAISITDSFFYYKNNELIKHHEDDSMASIYRKYRSYGKDQIILMALPKYNASNLASHSRELSLQQLIANLVCSPLISIRGVSFLIGMFSRKLSVEP